MSTTISLNILEQCNYYHKQMKIALASNDRNLFDATLHKLISLQNEFIGTNRKKTELLLQKVEINRKLNESVSTENDERIKQKNYKKCLSIVR